MYTNITVLSARRESLARWVNSNRVDGTAEMDKSQTTVNLCMDTLLRLALFHSQMSSYSTDLLLEHTVVEPRLEFTASSRCRRYASGVLTTSYNDVGLQRGNDSAVEGRF
jgi:hypothetical protein